MMTLLRIGQVCVFPLFSGLFLLNTHYHGAYSGGNEAFADAATILAFVLLAATDV